MRGNKRNEEAGSETRVQLPAGESILKVLTLRNPTQAELDRLLMPIKPPPTAPVAALKKLKLATADRNKSPGREFMMVGVVAQTAHGYFKQLSDLLSKNT